MKTLIFETPVKQNKNHYTVVESNNALWVKAPTMKKTLYGVEIKAPTAYRVYAEGDSQFRTWVFGELEINPDRFNLEQIKA